MSSTRISAMPPSDMDPSKAPVAFGNRALPRLALQLQDTRLLTRQRALAVLCDLVHDPERAYEVTEAGCLGKLKALLQDKDTTVRVKTTEILHLLANHLVSRLAFLEHHVVVSLSDLLDDPVPACRRNVHRALQVVAQFPAGANCLLSLGLVQRLVVKLSKQEEEEEEEIQGLILATLSSCVRVEAKPTLATNGVPILHNLLSHPSSSIRCAAARVMVAISVSREGKDMLCEEEVLPVLVKLLCDSDPGVKANAAGTIMNTAVITKGKYQALKSGAIPPLLALVTSEDTAVCANALRALTVLAEVPSARQKLLEHVPLLETRLSHPVAIIQRAAATAIRVITWLP
ncbi:radial spoke head 14 homolog isoform X2 [Paramormyrops kingsleyae]|uniref:Radial spoke head 14 homolog n=1 Tax=Paramormyrops kingsleyae TaxID=1676925 RepID=A0A3B3QBH6_9TELE|nr:radial spoke head 14 homolog [Paramormyrops kingsleyae]